MEKQFAPWTFFSLGKWRIRESVLMKEIDEKNYGGII
jgi:hypothetical protein